LQSPKEHVAVVDKQPHSKKILFVAEGKTSALADVFEVPVALAQVLVSTLTLSLA